MSAFLPYTNFPGLKRPPLQSDGLGGSLLGIMDGGGNFGSPTNPFGGAGPGGMTGVSDTGGGGTPVSPIGGDNSPMAQAINLFGSAPPATPGAAAPTHYNLGDNGGAMLSYGTPKDYGFGPPIPGADGGGNTNPGGTGTTPGGTGTPPGDNPFARPAWSLPGGTGGPSVPGGTPDPSGNPFARPSWSLPGGAAGRPANNPGTNPLDRGTGTPGGGGNTGGSNNNFNYDANGFGSWGRFLLDPQLQSGFSDALKAAQARFNDPNGMTYYNGPTVAGLTGDESNADAMIRNLAMTGGNGTLGAANSSFQNLTNLGNGGVDPQLEAQIRAMRASAVQDFQGAGGPMADIRSQGLADGAYGGSRQAIAEGTAMGRLGTALAGNEANMRMGNLTSNRDRAASLIGQTGNMVGANANPALMLSAAGSQQRGIDQAQYDSNLNAWKYNTTQPDVRLQNLYGALSGSLPMGGVNVNQQTMPGWMTAALQSSTQGSGGNNLGSIVALLGALGGFSSFFKGS